MNINDVKNWYNRNKNIITWVLAACFVIVFYKAVSNFDYIKRCVSELYEVVSPFVWGIIIAYLLKPIYNAIARLLSKVVFIARSQKVCNMIAIVGTYCLSAGIAALFLIAVLPPLADSILNLIQNLPTIGQQIIHTVQTMVVENEILHNVVNEWYQRADAALKMDIIPNITELVNVIAEGTIGTFGMITNLFIGVIVSVYLLADKQHLAESSSKFIDTCFKPHISQAIKQEIIFIDKIFTRYITGTLLDAGLVGLVTYIFALIFGLPSPMLLAIIIAITNIIPIVGPFIGAVPTALLVLAYTPDKLIVYCIYLLILQQIDGHVFVPKVLGSVVGISGLTALFAIVVGGGLCGIPGMILGVPVITVLIDIGRKISKSRQSNTNPS